MAAIPSSLGPETPRANYTPSSARFSPPVFALALLAALLLVRPLVAQGAGIAYGTVNNFDTVNGTSNICHGFEIELDDIHSADITYTCDYNHYGTPAITEDTWSVPGQANVHVFYRHKLQGHCPFHQRTPLPPPQPSLTQ